MIIVKAWGVSDIGYVKSANEDHYSIIPPDFPGMPYLLAVSDGVGGRKGGQFASVKILQVIGNIISNQLPNIENAQKILIDSFQLANKELRKLSDKYETLKGMGTTAVVTLIYDSWFFVCSIGDSRAYAIKDGNIFRITKDHSMTQELLDRGHIKESQLKNHPYRHHLVKALGIDDQANPDIFRHVTTDCNWLVMCSDGLTEHVEEKEILAVTLKENDPKAACQKLLQMTLSRGGSDNVTIVVAKISQE